MKKNIVVPLLIALVIAFLFPPRIAVAAEPITTVSAPTGLKAVSTGYYTITLSWKAVPNADGYRIYQATSLTGKYKSIAVTKYLKYSNSELTTGKTYYYKVKAYKNTSASRIYGKYSAATSAKPLPSTPSNPKGVSTGYNSTKLTWNKVSGATGYQVYRATSSKGSYSLIKSTPYISYNNTKLTAGRTYYYKIRAYKLIGKTKVYGKFSTIISAKPIPTAPSAFKSTGRSNSSIQLSWEIVNGVSGYQISRATSKTGKFSSVKTTTSSSFTNTGLTEGRYYYYKIRSYKTIGTTKIYSKFTNVLSVATDGFNAETAVKNIESEFIDTDGGVIGILTNKNSYPISLSATMVFYDANGLMLGKSTEDNYYFEAGKKCALNFYRPYDSDYNEISYDHYKVVYSADNTEYATSNLSDIVTNSYISAADNVMVEISNTGNKTSLFTQVAVIFYKDGKAVAYDYTYAECNKPGSTDYLEFSFPYDENFDAIQIDNYGLFVNSSYNYTFN